jgi:hypothetical protein
LGFPPPRVGLILPVRAPKMTGTDSVGGHDDEHTGRRDAAARQHHQGRFTTGWITSWRRHHFGRQDIRLAVVLNGGVSLAIWISGVTLELHHLAMARPWNETTYCPLLDLDPTAQQAWESTVAVRE